MISGREMHQEVSSWEPGWRLEPSSDFCRGVNGVGSPVPLPFSSSFTCKTCMDTLAHTRFLSGRSHDFERRIKNRGTITTCSLARICKGFRRQLVFLWAWSGEFPSTRQKGVSHCGLPSVLEKSLRQAESVAVCILPFLNHSCLIRRFLWIILFLRRYRQPGKFPHTSHLREHSVQRTALASYGYTTRTTDTAWTSTKIQFSCKNRVK